MSQASKRIRDLSGDQKRALLEQLLREKARYSRRFPLSFAQERLWFLHQLEPASANYNVPFAVRLVGSLNQEALQQTLSEISRRHEILRTTFPSVEGQPVQIISAPGPVALPVVDLTQLVKEEKDIAVTSLVTEGARCSFDLAKGPLMDLRLLKLADDEHIAIFNMHHIISDGWSMSILIHELAALYGAFTGGEISPLGETSIQYADFAVWQRERLQGEALESQLAYWKRRLAGNTPRLELPLDKPRPAIQRFEGETQFIEMDEYVHEQLRKMSQREGTTLFMTMLAAFKVLLYRYSSQQEISVGTPVAGRNRAEIENLIGFFVNTLVMKSRLEDRMTFRQVLRQEKDVVRGAFAHQDLPFEKLVMEIQPIRSLSYSPLFQVMFSLQFTPREELSLPEITLHPYDFDLNTAKFDLTLSIISTESLHAALEYNTDLFEAATITRMLRYFSTLARSICANPDRPISTLELMTEKECRQLLFDWNATDVEYMLDACPHQLFEAQVERTPDAVALVFEEEVLTCDELNRRSNQLAHYLQDLGVGPDVIVGICIERSIEMIVGIFGILKAGGAYLPLDPEYPKDRLEFIVEDSRARVVLVHQSMAESGFGGARVVCLDREWKEVATYGTQNPASGVEAQNLAYVIYTSGSTGQPKGVMIAHRNICNRLQWGQDFDPMTESDSMLQAASLSFDVSVWEIFASLIAGARLIIPRPGGSKDTRYLVRTVVEHQVTIIAFVPSLLNVFLDENGVEACRSLKQVEVGGEPLLSETRDRFLARMNAELLNFYGPTETCVDATLWRCKPGGKPGITSIGRPLANVRTYVLDANLLATPLGVHGELYVAGEGLGRGYLNGPGQTAEKFVPNPYSDQPGARMYATGDRVRFFPDGNIEFISRLDQQVKIRGFRIELGEIEAVLAQHPNVKEAVVEALSRDGLRMMTDPGSLLTELLSTGPAVAERLLGEITQLSDEQVELALDQMA